MVSVNWAGASSFKITQISFSIPVAPAFGSDYNVSDEQAGVAETAKANADKVIEEAKKLQSNYAKLEYCFNYIKDNVEYGETNSTNFNTWQMLWVFDGNTETNVVCEGYSKAFKYLCDGIGIECYTVTGDAVGGHMWNIVVLGEESYLVDVTNCDGNNIGNPDNLFLKSPTSVNGVSYTFEINESNTITFAYDQETIALFGAESEILKLADHDYAYKITIEDSENGTITADSTYAAEGDIVTLTATPKEGYELQEITVTDGKDETVTVTGNQFTMPKGAVNITATFVEAKAKISLEDATVTVENSEKVYDGKKLEPTITVSIGGVPLTINEDYTISCPENMTDAGEKTITITGIGDYSGEITKTCNITKKELTVSEVIAEDKVYDGTDKIKIKSVTLNGVVDGESVEVDCEGLQGTLSSADANTYTAVRLPGLTLKKGDKVDNYTLTQPNEEDIQTSVTINKADIEVTIKDSYQKNSNDVAFKLEVATNLEEASVTYEVTEGMNVVSVTDEGTVTISEAGEATITVSVNGGSNYNIATKEITINVAQVYGITVDENLQNGTVTVDKPTAVAGETVTLTVKPDEKYDLYELIVKDESDNAIEVTDDYQFTMPESSVTITATFGAEKIELTKAEISLSTDKVTYTGNWVCPGLLVVCDGETLILDTDYEIGYPDDMTNVGEKELVVKGKGNYKGQVTVTYTIEAKELTIKGVIAENKKYDGTNIVEITSVTLDGIVGIDEVSVDLKKVQGTVKSADVGDYTEVTLSGLALTGDGAGNYILIQPESAFVASVEITKNTAEITAETTQEKTYKDSEFDLGVTTNIQGAEVKYEVTSGTDVVFVSKDGKVTILKAGDATIKVSVPGSTNYTAAEDVIITITVAKANSPADIQPISLTAPSTCTKVRDVTGLPEGWVWAEADKEKELTAGVEVEATAEYIGEDKDNYISTTMKVVITRSTCEHRYTSKVTKPATTKETGIRTYTCIEGCGHSYEEVIPKKSSSSSSSSSSTPTTQAPSTEEPSTEEPSTEEPSTGEPSTEEPSTGEPSTENPGTGETTTVEWKSDEKGVYYEKEDGTRAEGWLKLDNEWYFFDKDGYRETDWVKDGNTWYYLDENGVMETGWLKDEGKWYYLDKSGAMQTDWVKDGNTWYYLNTDGSMKTGWLKDEGKWYYLNDNGSMKTGWLKDGETWYYLNTNGSMKTGWIQLGADWFYLNDSGAMATDTYIGIWYVDENGYYIPSKDKKN